MKIFPINTQKINIINKPKKQILTENNQIKNYVESGIYPKPYFLHFKSTKADLYNENKAKKEYTIEEKIQILKKQNCKDKYIDEFINYDSSKFEKIIDLLERRVTTYFIKEILELDEKKYQRTLNILNKDVDSCLAVSIAALDDKKYQRACDLLDKNADSYSAKVIADLDDDKYKRACDLLDKNVSAYYAADIAQFDDKQYEICLNEIEQGEAAWNAIKVSEYDDSRYSKYKNLLVIGKNKEQARDLSDLNEIKYKKYEKLIEQVKDHAIALKLTNYDEKEFLQYQEYVKNGIRPMAAIEFVGYNESFQKQIIRLSLGGIKTADVTDIINCKDIGTIDRIIELLEYGTDLNEALETGNDIEAYTELISQINSKPNAMRNFLNSDTYNEKIRKATQGKYQNQLYSLLNSEKMSFETKKSLLNCKLNENEFINSIKKLATSSYKLAMDTPNQYLSDIDIKYTTKINGKYPTLPEDEMQKQQEEINKFFSTQMGEIAHALKYVDSDTLNQLMDQRTSKFSNALADLNELNDENCELLFNLTQKCKTKYTKEEKNKFIERKIINGKSLDTNQLKELQEKNTRDLTAKEKIQLCQIVEIFQKSNINTAILKQMQEKGIVNLKDAKLAIQKEILKSVGITENELSKIPTEKLNFNEEFSYLTLKNNDFFTNKTTDEIETAIFEKDKLKTVIKESALNDFSKFINDEKNIYGQTNKRTKNLFTENGINYEQWLNPNIDDVKFDLNGEKMTIKMWERNPQEDLFIGNKTSCCTAIGDGNGNAIPIYLLNTSFNIVELFNEAGNVVGMSRVFMTNKNSAPVLIMDNIELNSNYKDTHISDEAAIEIRNNFFKYMNNYAKKITDNENSQVYFYSGDIHVPKSDLKHEYFPLDFIGDLSQKLVYLNAIGGWINPKELSQTCTVDFLVVPNI